MNEARKTPAVGAIALANRVVLAPMSGVTDAPFRRLVSQLGAGLVVSEMVASDKLVDGRRDARLRAEGQGTDIHVVQLAGCEAHWMSAATRIAQDSGAAIIDINMGCPGQARDQWAIRLRADARSRSRIVADRGDCRRRNRACDAQDAARLGRSHPQRARARAACGKCRHQVDHRARPHTLSVLQRQSRLERRARGERRRDGSGGGEWRHQNLRRRRCGAHAFWRRHGHGRTRGAGPSVASRPDRTLSRNRPARG